MNPEHQAELEAIADHAEMEEWQQVVISTPDYAADYWAWPQLIGLHGENGFTEDDWLILLDKAMKEIQDNHRGYIIHRLKMMDRTGTDYRGVIAAITFLENWEG